MWTGTVAFAHLQKKSRWKVEFFCSDATSKVETAYESTTLRQLFDERRESIDPQAYPDHVFNYLGLEHVESLTGDLVNFQPRRGKEILSRSKVFREGDILYARLRPYLNKVFLARGVVAEGICSGEFYVLTPDASLILPRFARALLTAKYVQDYVVGLLTGSALPRLQLEDLLAIEIPLPPVEQQQAFEEFLVREDARRRTLVNELTGLPGALIDAVVGALESGKKPTTPSIRNAGNEIGRFRNPLPPGDFFSGRKGKESGARQELLKFS
jgi:hypothetical protein